MGDPSGSDGGHAAYDAARQANEAPEPPEDFIAPWGPADPPARGSVAIEQHIERKRFEKCNKVVGSLMEALLEMVDSLEEADWGKLAAQAGVRTLSAESRALVRELLAKEQKKWR